jgi:isopenicillin N synthase-like dioxygenase
VGFVYIINHSLPGALLDEAFHWSRLFFDLPMGEKLRAPHPEGWAVHRGYSWPGLEKVSQAVSADNDDDERTTQLREVPDIKVGSRWAWVVAFSSLERFKSAVGPLF